ncbi:unnamed protein product, partial [Didymodactylos carnosus]
AYGTKDLQEKKRRELYDGKSERDIVRLIIAAIEAVERFDKEHVIGNRKLSTKKIIGDRLTKYFEHSGKFGIRFLDDILNLAKRRSNNRTKYIPMAINMLKNKLNRLGSKDLKKGDVKFMYTLESLLNAIDDERDIINTLLETEAEFQIQIPDPYRYLNVDHLESDTLFRPLVTQDEISLNITNPFSRELEQEYKYKHILEPILEEIGEDFPVSSSELTSFHDLSTFGLSSGQLSTLMTGHISRQHEQLKISMSQIELIGLNQGLSKDQLKMNMRRISQEKTKLPHRFYLTPEQFVLVSVNENIKIQDLTRIPKSQCSFRLNIQQIRCLIKQMNRNLKSNQSTALTIQIDQLIALCAVHQIELNTLLKTYDDERESSDIDINFHFLPEQLAWLMMQNHFDLSELDLIEKNLTSQLLPPVLFRLNKSQFEYLFANQRIGHDEQERSQTNGLTPSQLIALYTLQQPSATEIDTNIFKKSKHFLLTYDQIENLAIIQGMTLEHFKSLRGVKQQLFLSSIQIVQIAIENDISIKQLLSFPLVQRTRVMTHEQLCSIISKNHKPLLIKRQDSINKQRLFLTIEQLLLLATRFHAKADDLMACTVQYNNSEHFQLHSEQLTTLRQHLSNDEIEEAHNKLVSSNLSFPNPSFTLTDEQFGILLFQLPPSAALTKIKITSPTLNISQHTRTSTTFSPKSMKELIQLTNDRLKDSVLKTIQLIHQASNVPLKQVHIESAMEFITEISMNTMDNEKLQGFEMMPAYVIDALKIGEIPIIVYDSIIKKQLTTQMIDEKEYENKNLPHEIVDMIREGELSRTLINALENEKTDRSKIEKIQEKLLSPMLNEEIQNGTVSKQVLDAYKSHSQMELLQKIRRTTEATVEQITNADTDSILTLSKSTIRHIENDQYPQGSTIVKEKSKEMSNFVQLFKTPTLSHRESVIKRKNIIEELRHTLSNIKENKDSLKQEFGIEPIQGSVSIQKITEMYRETGIAKELEIIIGREIDEVDVLNMLSGETEDIVSQTSNESRLMMSQNIAERNERTNYRLNLFHHLITDIELIRLKRQLTTDEYLSVVCEDIEQVEMLTKLKLNINDLRIITMDRFHNVIEHALSTYQLNESEIRTFLNVVDKEHYIEQHLLKRNLSLDEKIELEELSVLPYYQLFEEHFYQVKRDILQGKVIQTLDNFKIIPTHEQLQKVLEQRAEIVDQYDVISALKHVFFPIEKLIERRLTIDEKKSLAANDFSVINKRPKKESSASIIRAKINRDKGEEEQILLINPVIDQIIEKDENLIDNLKKLELHRTAKEEIIDGLIDDKDKLEKSVDKQLDLKSIKDLYGECFEQITRELDRDLTGEEYCNLIQGKFSDIEICLGRLLTANECKMCMSINLADVAALQIKMVKSKDDAIDERENILEHSLNHDDVKRLIDEEQKDPKKLLERALTEKEVNLLVRNTSKKFDQMLGSQTDETQLEKWKSSESITKRNCKESISMFDSQYDIFPNSLGQKLTKEDFLASDKVLSSSLFTDPIPSDQRRLEVNLHTLKQPIYFDLVEIENAIERILTNDELNRFASTRFTQIQKDLKKSLTDVQISKLLKGDIKIIEKTLNRQLTLEEKGPHLIDLDAIEGVLTRELNLHELVRLAGDQFDELRKTLNRPLLRDELRELIKGNQLIIDKVKFIEVILNRPLSSLELLRFAHVRYDLLTELLGTWMTDEMILEASCEIYTRIEKFLGRTLITEELERLKKDKIKIEEKYPNSIDEIEYIIGRPLNEQETRRLAGNKFDQLVKRLGRSLTVEQLRDCLRGNYDETLGAEFEQDKQLKHALKQLKTDEVVEKGKKEDSVERDQVVAKQQEKTDDFKSPKLEDLSKLEQFGLLQDDQTKDRTEKIRLISSDDFQTEKKWTYKRLSDTKGNIDFDQHTMNLLDQLTDVIQNLSKKQQDDLQDIQDRLHRSLIPLELLGALNNDYSLIEEHENRKLTDDEKLAIRRLISPVLNKKKADGKSVVGEKSVEVIIPRVVSQISSREHVEPFISIKEAIGDTSSYLSGTSYRSDMKQITPVLIDHPSTASTHQPTVLKKSAKDRTKRNENVHSGWSVLKAADIADRGVPERYATNKAKQYATLVYSGGDIPKKLLKMPALKEIKMYISELIRSQQESQATHLIIPSKPYFEKETVMYDEYENEIIEIYEEDDEICDSPETLQWYNECLERNIRIHAQIPLGITNSVIFCHTGRHGIINPSKRSIPFSGQPSTKENIHGFSGSSLSLKGELIENEKDVFLQLNGKNDVNVVDYGIQVKELPRTTITELILATVTRSNTGDLLEVLDDLFSEDNLLRYQITEAHWQEIFLILLNTYLQSQLTNRKEIFQRLTNKLNELKKKNIGKLSILQESAVESIVPRKSMASRINVDNRVKYLREGEVDDDYVGSRTSNLLEKSSILYQSPASYTSPSPSQNYSASSTLMQKVHLSQISHRPIKVQPVTTTSDSSSSSSLTNSQTNLHKELSTNNMTITYSTEQKTYNSSTVAAKKIKLNSGPKKYKIMMLKSDHTLETYPDSSPKKHEITNTAVNKTKKLYLKLALRLIPIDITTNSIECPLQNNNNVRFYHF